jgi:hypothetical protein
VNELADLLEQHLAVPFPDSVTKGIDYGQVDPVMIDADIYGWASRVAAGAALSPLNTERLTNARDQLLGSLDAFPDQARPYYEHLVHIADLALAGP